MNQRSTGFLALAVAFAALTAGCGGGSVAPGTNPTASPSPTSSPSSAPSYTFGGSTLNANFAQGTTPSAIALAAYHNVSASVQFVAPTSGNGALDFSDALNNGDVSPNTLPSDNATAGYSAVIYLSVVNPGSTTISFGANIPSFQITNSVGFAGAASCHLDIYGANGSGTTASWFYSGASANISGNSVTVGPAQLQPGNTVEFQSGQQIVAISCH